MQNKIAIIDADSVAYTIGNGNKVLDESGLPKRTIDGRRFIYTDKTEEELIQSANQVMKSILSNCGATHYVLYIKGLSTTVDRLKVNPEYKKNRSGIPPVWWNFVKQYLIANWNAIEVHGSEVDDYVNIARLTIPDSFICAIDGDLLSLQGEHYNWRENIWIINTHQDECYKFWLDMICGQKGDNITGIVGKGESFANKLFKDIPKTELSKAVFTAYITCLGENNGIKEFYKNYISLFILDSHPDFVIPEITPVNIKQTQVNNDLFS